jgi:hypothetical protein
VQPDSASALESTIVVSLFIDSTSVVYSGQ